MGKIEDIRGISDISGMGGGYEQGCQNMLQAGWVWMNKNKDPKLEGSTLKNVYGIFKPESEDAKALSKAAVAGADGDCTGAMHQAVMSHLFYINKNGLDKWKVEVVKDDE